MFVMESIWRGVPIKDERHLGEVRYMFLKSMYKTGNDREIARRVQNAPNELDRVQLLKKHFTWKKIPSDYMTQVSKTLKTSQLLKENANKMYKEQNFVEALRGYNLAIMFAPTDSSELGIAFGNRSALFMETKNFALALRDIQLARECNYPAEMMDKLRSREIKCCSVMKNNKISAHPDRKMNSSMSNEEMEEAAAAELYRQENFMRLRSRNPRIPHAESFIKIDSLEGRGRRLVATANIKAGTLLCAEKPYAHMLVNILIWDTEHCHFCCRPILGGIPCTECSFAFYCTKECRDTASAAYHKYEHKIFGYFHHNPPTCLLRDILSLRMLFTVGPLELFRIFKTQDPAYIKSTRRRGVVGLNSDGIYDSSSYLTAYHLISHLSHLKPSQLIANTFKALLYSHIVDEHTEFFSLLNRSYSEQHSRESFMDFITSFIIHHMENIPFNAISVSKLKCMEVSRLLNGNMNERESKEILYASNDIETVAYAMATYTLLSLCNHSCDPNVVPLRKPDQTNLSLVALKNIQKGEELCISYGPIYHSESTQFRREYLQAKYNFLCDCRACNGNWEPKSTADEENVCNGLAKEVEFEEERNVELKNKLLFVDDLITKGKFIEAIENVKPCLTHLTDKHPSTFPLTKMSQDLFKRALVWLFNTRGVYN